MFLVKNKNEYNNFLNIFKEKYYNKYNLFVLKGEMGSGKTYFMKQMFGNTVSSPTFCIVNTYELFDNIFHFDIYRLEKVNYLDLINLNFFEYLKKGKVFIEWGDLINFKLENYLTIKFSLDRKIEIFEV